MYLSFSEELSVESKSKEHHISRHKRCVCQELEDLEAEHKASSDLFEKQKEEAMATMKRSEDLKQLDFLNINRIGSTVLSFFLHLCLFSCFGGSL